MSCVDQGDNQGHSFTCVHGTEASRGFRAPIPGMWDKVLKCPGFYFPFPQPSLSMEFHRGGRKVVRSQKVQWTSSNQKLRQALIPPFWIFLGYSPPSLHCLFCCLWSSCCFHFLRRTQDRNVLRDRWCHARHHLLSIFCILVEILGISLWKSQ